MEVQSYDGITLSPSNIFFLQTKVLHWLGYALFLESSNKET